MTFADLPADWALRPLTDEAILPSVVDLVVSDADRVAGALYALLCGPTDRLVQPCALTDLQNAPADPRGVLDPFLHAVAQSMDNAGIVLVIARSGRPEITDGDRHWHEAAIASCRLHDVRLLAVAVATPRGVWRVPDFANAWCAGST